MPKPESMRTDCQLIGNTGLYVVCWQLSKRGWNVMPTSRNAKGVDIIGYKGNSKITIQVKALSKRVPVPMGKKQTAPIADFFVIARCVTTDNPEFFISHSAEIWPLVHKGEKDGKVSYWLQPKAYEQFRNRWEIML